MDDEVMTLAEMEERFKSEWILVADPETDESLEIIRGRVVHHSPDRDEVYRKAVELKLKDSGIVYTGEMPEDTAIVLWDIDSSDRRA